MIRFMLRSFLVAAFLTFTLTAFAAPRVAHVFIISIDGGSPAVMLRSPMPVLKKLVAQGAHTWHAQTIVPSLTLPSHTSMLTGVRPDKHKVTWNNLSPTNGLVRVPTIFAAARPAGFSTAMFVGKEKFRHLLQPVTVDVFNFDPHAEVIVTKSNGSGTSMQKEGNVLAKGVAKVAADYIVKNKPNLCFIHLTDPDNVGHTFGWGSRQQIKAFAKVDAALGIILKAIQSAQIEEESVIIITADHGGHGRGHGSGAPEDMTIPWIAWGKGVKWRSEINVPVNTCDTAATALWLLDLQPFTPLDGVPVFSAFE